MFTEADPNPLQILKTYPKQHLYMKRLKVLDISFTGIRHLPPNIFSLEGLRIVGSMEVLQSCKGKDVKSMALIIVSFSEVKEYWRNVAMVSGGIGGGAVGGAGVVKDMSQPSWSKLTHSHSTNF
ncbi:hypothetical protein LXL04_010584 [Taraxacum kok-saghyz]